MIVSDIKLIIIVCGADTYLLTVTEDQSCGEQAYPNNVFTHIHKRTFHMGRQIHSRTKLTEFGLLTPREDY